MRWIDRICGTVTVTVSARQRRICTSLMLREGIHAVELRNLEDGGLQLELRQRDYRHLCRLVSDYGLSGPQIVSFNGFPQVLAYWRQRPGLPVGFCLALLIWIASTMFVWRVDVVCLDNAQGNQTRDTVDVHAVQAELAAAGIGQGMFLPGLDSRRLENRFLIGREDISWMAINRHGTVLSVEVRPSHAASHDEEPKLTVDAEGYLCGTNLVADADGRIVSFSVRGGQSAVQAEQTVLRGSLLASGIYQSETGDAIAGRAHGEFLAETVRILQTEIPLTEQIVQPTGDVRTTYTLILFGKPVLSLVWPPPDVREIVTFLETFRKNGEKSGIEGDSYGIITDEAILDAEESALYLPGGLPLPVSVRTTTRTDVTEFAQTLTEEEALLRAGRALDAQEAALGARKIFSREETVRNSGDSLTVTRYVSCIDNIAVEEEFRIRPQP